MDPAREQELILVLDCILGNRDALWKLVWDCTAAVAAGAAKALAQAPGPVSADPEDLVQQFFLEVFTDPWSLLKGFDARGPLAPWLAKVAFHRCSHMLRSHDLRWPGGNLDRDPSHLAALPARVHARVEPGVVVRRLME